MRKRKSDERDAEGLCVKPELECVHKEAMARVALVIRALPEVTLTLLGLARAEGGVTLREAMRQTELTRQGLRPQASPRATRRSRAVFGAQRPHCVGRIALTSMTGDAGKINCASVLAQLIQAFTPTFQTKPAIRRIGVIAPRSRHRRHLCIQQLRKIGARAEISSDRKALSTCPREAERAEAGPNFIGP